MKILTKYVLKEHIGPFIFASTALTSLMLLQFVGKRLGELVGKGLPWRVLVEFFVLSMPLTIAMTLPMAVLVAVLYAYSRLASENEITAMRANGVSMRSLLVPTLIAGTFVALVMLVFNDQVLSRANHQLAVLQNDIARTKPSFALKEQIINTVVDQKLYLRAARIDRGSQEMKDVVIYDVSNPAHRRTIYANHGQLGVADNHTDLVLHLYDGSMVEVPTEHPEQLTRLFFKQDLMRVQNVTNSFQASDADSASKSDREMSVCEMQKRFADMDFNWQQAHYDLLQSQAELGKLNGEANIRWPVKPVRRNPIGLGRIYCDIVAKLFGVKEAEAAVLPMVGRRQTRVSSQQAASESRQSAVGGQQSAVGSAQVQKAGSTSVVVPKPEPILRSLPQGPAGQDPGLQRMQFAGEQASAMSREKVTRFMRIRYDIEIQKKFSLAAACIIFVLLGAPIALRFPRGGVGLVIGVSFTVFALYYVGLIGGEPLANSELISPFWAMWSDNLLLFVVGVYLCLRMNRVSGTTRGGDWRELRDAFVHLLARLVGRAPREAV